MANLQGRRSPHWYPRRGPQDFRHRRYLRNDSSAPLPGLWQLSGFDDFVSEAITDGIHSKEFVLRILNRQGSENVQPSPAHRLKCMNCNIYYRHVPKPGLKIQRPASFSWSLVNDDDTDSIKEEVGLFGWAEGFGWAFGIKERDEDIKKQLDEKYNAVKAKEGGKEPPLHTERDPKKVLDEGVEHWDAGTEEEKRKLNVVDPRELAVEQIEL